MVNMNPSLLDLLLRNNNSSESTNIESNSQNSTNIIVSIVCVSVSIIIILVCYRLLNEFCRNKKQKNKHRTTWTQRVSSIFPIHSPVISSRNRISSIYIIPVRSRTVSDARGVSSLYPVPVRSNTISIITEESPPSYQTFSDTDSFTRF